MRSLYILSLLNLLAIKSKWVSGQYNPNFAYGGEFIPDISNTQPYYSGNGFLPYPYQNQIEDPQIFIDQNEEDDVLCEEENEANVQYSNADNVVIVYVPQVIYDAARAASGTLNMTEDESVSPDIIINHPLVTEIVETTTDYVNLFGSGTTTDADDHSQSSEELVITTTTSTIEITEINSGDGKETVSSDTNMSTPVPVIDGSELTEITTTAQHNSDSTESHIEDDGYDSSDEQVVIPNIVITAKNSNYEAIKPTPDENDIENDLDESVSFDTKINHPVTVVDDSGVAIVSKNDTNDNAETYEEAKKHVFKPNMVIQKKNIKYDIIKPTTDENDIESDLNKTVFSQVSNLRDIAEVQTEDTRSGIVTVDAAREISPTEASGLNAPSIDTEEKNSGDATVRLDSDSDGTTVAAIPKPNYAFGWF